MHLLYKTHWLSQIWCKFCQYLLAVHIQCHRYHDHHQQHFQATRCQYLQQKVHIAAATLLQVAIGCTSLSETSSLPVSGSPTATRLQFSWLLDWNWSEGWEALLLAPSALGTDLTVSHHWRSLGSLSLLTVTLSIVVLELLAFFSWDWQVEAALFLPRSHCSCRPMITMFSAILGDRELM